MHQAEAMEVAAHDDHVTGGVSTPSATATATIAGSRRSRSNRPNVSHNERTRVGAKDKSRSYTADPGFDDGMQYASCWSRWHQEEAVR